MPEAVIAAIGRTPVGRAVKGLQIDDVICGCALPGGGQGIAITVERLR